MKAAAPSILVILGWMPLALSTNVSGTAFRDPPAHCRSPKLSDHATDKRAFQDTPSIGVAPGGRRWAIWHAGPTPGEDQNGKERHILMASFPEQDVTVGRNLNDAVKLGRFGSAASGRRKP